MTRRLRGRSGFTLVELMIASIIFAMVIAGLAAIYTTALSQGGRVLGESRLKAMEAVALRNITETVMQADMVSLPPAGAAGQDVLTVCANVAPDGHFPITNGVPTTCWSFCVQPSATAACASPACLFGYSAPASAPGAWNFYPPPSVNTGNCGNAVSGQTPYLLASQVQNSTDPNYPNYFYRDTTVTDQIRVGFRLYKPATATAPPVVYDDGTTIAAQFDARL